MFSQRKDNEAATGAKNASKQTGTGSPDEKRRYHRIKIIMGLVCYRSQGNNINVFTDDVSVGGIKFFCHQAMAKKEDVKLEIPAGYGEIIKIDGHVAWIKENEGAPGSYEGGIEFSRMSEDNLHLWKKFIKRNSEIGQDIDI
ncbi:MAG: PilZ domain-containing protein [Firmicutes bacterium]|nr:PilZ domain-containing protein [Bacillota bacterium]